MLSRRIWLFENHSTGKNNNKKKQPKNKDSQGVETSTVLKLDVGSCFK